VTTAPTRPAGRISATGRPLDLAPDAFGELRRSDDALDNPAELNRRLADDGYLYLPRLLDREEVLAARRDVLARMAERGQLPDGPDRDELGGPDGDLSAVLGPTLPGTGEGLNEIPSHSALLQQLLYSGRMTDFYAHLFGEPIRHFDYTWLRLVGPNGGTPPHMDNVFMNRGTPNLLTAWTPLGDIDRTLGGLALMERSNHLDDLKAGYASLDVDTYCLNSDDPRQTDRLRGRHWMGYLSDDAVALREQLRLRWLTTDYQAGDVVTFTMFTAHMGLDNNTADRYRISTDTRYQRASEPADHRWIGPNPTGHGPDVVRGLVC
jgi:hypothetical protein